MAAAALLVLLLASTSSLVWEAMRRCREYRQPPRWDFTGCWVEAANGRVVAEGQAGPGTLLYDHFTIVANGRPIEMVVMELTFAVDRGTRWAARDAAGLKADVRVGADRPKRSTDARSV